jgi:hypothetical protein
VDGEDVRVIELPGGARLLLEAAHPAGISGEGLGNQLDRDLAPEARIARAIHVTHPAGTQPAGDLIGTELRSGGEGHGKTCEIPGDPLGLRVGVVGILLHLRILIPVSRWRPPMKITTLVTAALLLCSPPLAKADTVLDWNAIAIAAAGTQNPFNQARIMAITQLAVFEAVNTIEGRYQPYLGTLVAPAGASSSAAAVAAAHGVLKYYVPASAAMLDAARATSLAAIPDGPSKAGGVTTGEAAAAAMIMARLTDGSAVPEFSVPASTDPGVWQLTPSCSPAGGSSLHWRNVTPFGIENAADFIAAPPPALTSNQYAKDLNEVKRVGSKTSTERPQDRTDVARFYAGSSPAYVMNMAARQVATEQGRSLIHNARALALVNMAISDAAVASFATKYHYNFWRPETAIHGAALDDNRKTDADLTWEPLILTPCFPSYGSNHGSLCSGGAEVLRRIYGAGGHSITVTNPNFPTLVYRYSEFSEILSDISDARVYGGIHFRFDQEAGGRLGREVGTAVVQGNLRRVHHQD